MKYIKFIFLIILFLLFYFSFYFLSPNLESFTKDELSNIPTFDTLKDSIQTGDLIFTSGKTYPERIISGFTNSYFTHVGILVKENDIIYIWDSDIGQGVKMGPRFMLLEDKLKRYKGFKIGVVAKTPYSGNIKEDDIMKIVHKYIDKGMDNKMYSYFIDSLKDEDKLFCSELVIKTYQDLDLIDRIKYPINSKKYTPGDILDGKIINIKELKYFKF
jgi:hypothetical protein